MAFALFFVQIWVYNDKDRKWQQDGESLREHSDWVRDVAWAPNLGLPFSTIASAGQEGKVDSFPIVSFPIVFNQSYST